jgi:hypothetical protein
MSVVKHNSVLYDPETGECLNEETMKMIENVQNGTEKMTTYKSYGDFEKKCVRYKPIVPAHILIFLAVVGKDNQKK